MVKTGFNGSIVPIGNHEGYNCQGGGEANHISSIQKILSGEK
jgi:hypothetical protein